MERPKILVVEGDTEDRKVMEWQLRGEFDITSTHDTKLALSIVRDQKPRFVFLDVALCQYRELCGREQKKFPCFISEVQRYASQTKVIVTSDEFDPRCMGQAMRKGAYDFLIRPVDLNLLRCLIWRASSAGARDVTEAGGVREVSALDGKMLGAHEKIRQVLAVIQKVASVDISVLITGESGTGKELAARALHDHSHRKHGPFVPINCGAIPENLLEAELFGYEKGAFTGAWQQKVGKIEYARGGTLFLDEVGELSLGLQVKLLRFLDDRKIERVGGRGQIKVDARVVAATNVNLEEAILQRKFRTDLYYRLAAVSMELPPLRERGDDALLMATVFLNQAKGESGKRLLGFTPEAVSAIKEYRWPGNVRELLNKVRLAAVLAAGPYVTPKDLNLPQPGAELSVPVSLKEARRQFGAEVLVRALARHNGDLKEVAKELNVSRSMVYYLLNKYGLRGQPRSLH